MPTSKPARTSRRLVWILLVIAVVVALYFLPLFHVIPLQAAREQSAARVFDAAAFVETFWNDQLLQATRSAVDAGELLAAFQIDPADAETRFGHRLGLSSASSYLVSGRGRIVAVESGAISIALQDEDAAAVVIATGPVFGNAIRDGSGLLNVSDFPNSQDFNAISSEINRRVEEQVLLMLQEKAAVGAAVRFVGAVEIAAPETDVTPLRVVPVIIEFP
jgi:predicted lipoprotein